MRLSLATFLLAPLFGAGFEDAAAAPSAILIAVRSRDHMSRSSVDKFDQAVDGVEAYLEKQHIALLRDPLRGQVRIEGEANRETITRIAKDAGASQVLELVVNRPMSSWMELTLRCTKTSGELLWEVRSAASNQLTSKDHVRKALENLAKKLDTKLNGACLVTETKQ
jgi:hypothetical protein